MSLFREDAVVLRHQELSGADKIITFLTLGKGKVKAVAKGARRPKSRFSGSLEPLNLVEVVYFLQPGRSTLARLNHCELIEHFDPLRADYDLLIRGLYLAELSDSLFKEGVALRTCFEDLVGALRALSDCVDGDLVRWACVWRFLSALGYSPTMSSCVVCRAESYLVAFNPGLGGCLCEACREGGRDGIAISTQARRSLQELGAEPWSEIAKLSLSGVLHGEVGRTVEGYLLQHLDRQMKSAAFLGAI